MFENTSPYSDSIVPFKLETNSIVEDIFNQQLENYCKMDRDVRVENIVDGNGTFDASYIPDISAVTESDICQAQISITDKSIENTQDLQRSILND